MIDEDDATVGGITVGPEDVKEFRDQLSKRFHGTFKFMHLELLEVIEVVELTDEEQALLRGIEED